MGDGESDHPPSPTSHPLDKWLFARLDQLVATARERLDAYDARGFAAEVESFLDDMSNWYVRRSRRRFWGVGRGVSQEDKQAAYATLYLALVTLARVLAPVLPFLSEALYQNLVRSVDASAPASVHLTGYPNVADQRRKTNDERGSLDADRSSFVLRPSSQEIMLLTEMETVRRVVGLGRVARKSAGLRVRQPLGRMLVAVAGDAERAALLRHQEDVLEELNIKWLELLDPSAELLSYQVKPHLRLLGPRLGKGLPALREALAALDDVAAANVAHAVAAGQPTTLRVGDQELTLEPAELLVESAPLVGYAVAQEGGVQVALDTTLDEALLREGRARDLVRAVQEARKGAGLALSDRITLYLADGGADGLRQLLDEWGTYVQAETLAETLVEEAPPGGVYAETLAFDGATVTVGVARR
jgi:isoleucyl-tRNA synthetase